MVSFFFPDKYDAKTNEEHVDEQKNSRELAKGNVGNYNNNNTSNKDEEEGGGAAQVGSLVKMLWLSLVMVLLHLLLA